jgi:hypothetical protein
LQKAAHLRCASKVIRFHAHTFARATEHGYFAFGRFSAATREVVCNPSFGFIVVSLVCVFLGAGLAFIPRLRGWSYFVVSLGISIGGFLTLTWPDLPLGATLASPEGPVAVAIYHLIPFLILFYVPIHAGYFATRLIRRRCSRRAPII